MSGDVEARRLGEKLLADVEVKGLSKILSSLRMLDSEREDNATTNTTPFSIPELDAQVSNSSPTILELVSPAPTHHPSGAGKTSLLYLIIAHAILPSSSPFTPDMHGQDAAIILIDPLRHFSIPRLATVLLHLLTTALNTPLATLSPSTKASLLHLAHHSLSHLHIFHPTSWPSLLETLSDLPTYLFNPSAHQSTHRRIHSLILDDIDAFTWPLRAAHSHDKAAAGTHSSNPLSAASSDLTTALVQLRNTLQCNVVLTSASVLPYKCYPALPAQWPRGLGVTRMCVRRAEVLRFAPEMGVEQAVGEGPQRWDVVERGRFEAVLAGKEEEGFVFRVWAGGVGVEREG